jgi:hypothetical protein
LDSAIITRKRLIVFAIQVIILVGGLCLLAPPAHAFSSSGASCVTATCPAVASSIRQTGTDSTATQTSIQNGSSQTTQTVTPEVDPLTTNTGDTYSQNWVGLRPVEGGENGGETLNFNQTVTNYNTDGNIENMLAVKVGTLQTGTGNCPVIGSSIDCVGLSVAMNANSRAGISYGFPTTESINYAAGGTDLGIKCECGVWSPTLPVPLVFYGAPGEVEYTSVWVSSDGYISVNGPPSPGASPTGIIAPFERPMNPGLGGHVYYYAGSNNDFFIMWDQVPTIANGNPESFLLHVYSATDVDNSAYQQSGFEFQYGTVTPNDGVATFVGINDQYGHRSVSVPSSEYGQYVVNGQGLVWKASSGPYYLNHLTLTLTDTSNGATDTQAMVIRDPRYAISPYNLQKGDPVGYHVVLNTQVPGTIVLPEYAKVALTVASLIPSSIAGDIIPTGSGDATTAVDVYNALLADYFAPSLPSYYDQSTWGDSKPAEMGVSAAEYNAQTPGVVPVDASFGGEFVWLFDDAQRNVPHDLTITATVGYIGGSGYALIGHLPDLATVQTTVNLDINPGYQILTDNFTPGTFNTQWWTESDQWTTVLQCPPNDSPCFGGQYRAWTGTSSSGLSTLQLTLGNIQGFTDIVLYLHLWVGLGQGSVQISYQNQGLWTLVATYSGQTSELSPDNITPYTQWIVPRIDLPTTVAAVKFVFSSPGSTDGLYLADPYLIGQGPSNSAVAQVLGKTGDYHLTPVSVDGAQYSDTPYYLLVSAGSQHTFAAESQFTDSSGSYGFNYWQTPGGQSTPTSVTATISSDTTYTAVYVQIPDFILLPNPSSQYVPPGGQGTYNIQLTSRDGFTGTVMLSVSITPVVANGPTVTISPQSVSLSGGTGSATVTANAPSNVPFQQFTITVTGTASSPANGSTWNLSFQTTMTFFPGEYTIEFLPSPVSTNDNTVLGGSIGVGSQGGYSGSVTVTATGPYGPGNFGPGYSNSVTVSVSGSNYCCTWIDVSFNIPKCASGTVDAVIQATDGSIEQTVYVPITVTKTGSCDFTISSSPSSVPADGATISTTTVQTVPSTQGIVFSFSSTLGTLSATTCTTGSTGSCSVNIASNQAGSATITATAPFYPSHQTSVTFTDFSVSTNPQTVTLTTGTIGTSTISLAALNGFSGPVILSIGPVPSSLGCSSISPGTVNLPPSPATATLSCGGSFVGSYTVTITANSGSLTHTATTTFTIQGSLTLTANPVQVPSDGFSTSTITVQTSNNEAGISVALSTNLGTLSTSNCTTGSGGACTVTITSPTAGVGTVTATAPYYSSTTTTLVFASISLTANPSTVIADGSTTSTLTAQLSTSAQGVMVSFTTTGGTLSAASCSTGSTGSCSITIKSSQPGIFVITATAPSYVAGSASVAFAGISLSANPSTVSADGSTTSTITAQLSTNAQGVAVSFSTNGGTLSAASCSTGSTGSCSITIKSSQPGIFVITATAPSYRAGTTAVSFFDFSITTSPLSLDGEAQAACSSSTSACTASLTTTHQNDVIIVYTFEAVDSQSSCGFIVHDSAGLTWNLRASVSGRNDGVTGNNRDQIAEYWATSPTTLSGDPIVESIVGCGNNANGLEAIAIQGANLNSPFDPNTSVPATIASTGSVPSLQISISNSKDMIISAALETFFQQCSGALIPGNGYGFITQPGTLNFCNTAQNAGGGTAEVENGYVQTPQGGLIVNFNGNPGQWWEQIVDAITPGPSPVIPGATTTSSIVIAGLNGSAGTVSLSETVPNNLTCGPITPATFTVLPFFQSASTITCSSTIAGTYAVTVTATSGTISHTTTVTVVVTDFSINAVPNAITIFAGGTASASINVNSLNGWTGTVSLSASPSSTNCYLSPTSVSLGPNTSVNLFCPESSGGQYSVTVTGTSGSISHSVQVTIYVADFSISASPSSITTLPSSGQSVTLTITANAQWIGWSIYLFSTGPSFTGTQFSQYPTPGPGQTVQVTVTLSVSVSATAGNYVVQVTGETGSLQHSVNISLAVQDVSVSASPSSVTVADGRSGLETVTVTSLNNYAGTVSLSTPSLPACVTASFNPASVSVTAGSSPTSTLTLNAAATCMASNVSVTVQVAYGPVTRATTITMSITDYSISVSPQTIGIWSTNTATVTVTGTSLNGYTGTVSLTTIGLPSCLSTGNFVYSPTSIAIPSGGKATSSLTLSFGSCGTVTEPVAIQGSDTVIARTTPFTVGYGTFVLSASPNQAIGYPGTTTTAAITVSQLVGGASDTVTLSWGSSSLPAACGTPTFNPSTIALPGGGTSTLSVNVGTSCPVGTYQISVSGSAHKVSGTTTFNLLVVADFSISANPTSLSIYQTMSGSSTISLTSLGGYSGTVTVSASSNAVIGGTQYLYWDFGSCGVTDCTQSLTVPAEGTATTTITIFSYSNTPPGTYTVTVTGTDSTGLIQSVNISVTVLAYTQGGGGGGCSPSPMTAQDSTKTRPNGGPHPC